MNNWDNVRLVPEFNEQGVACYRLDGGDYVNEYYITSEAETRKLLNTPEVVGYEVYNCLIPSTCQMLYYLKEQKKVTTANILSILRGALNYPLEEACYKEHIRVHVYFSPFFKDFSIFPYLSTAYDEPSDMSSIFCLKIII